MVVDEHVLEKPADAADAARMLRLVAGRGHEVLTGICLREGSSARTAVERTGVRVARLSERDIEEYVASGEPFGKAGAYGIQGMFSRWVVGVEAVSYTHLDVYKRQVQHSRAGGRQPGGGGDGRCGDSGGEAVGDAGGVAGDPLVLSLIHI